MGTMSNIDHSSDRAVVTAEMGPLTSQIQDLTRLVDFIARKEQVVIDTVPEINIVPSPVHIDFPEVKSPDVKVDVKAPVVNVSNTIEVKALKLMAWLVGCDVLLRLAEGIATLWHTASTMSK